MGSFNPSYDKIFSHLQHVKYKGEGSLDAYSLSIREGHTYVTLRKIIQGVGAVFIRLRAAGG
jgi:hypothetical protein